VEDDHDVLTCGKCQQEFALYDINQFIQHKVSRCNKENVQPHNNNDDVTAAESLLTSGEDGEEGGGASKSGGASPVRIKEISDEKACGKNLKEIFENKDSLERLIREGLCSKGQGGQGEVKQEVKVDASPSSSKCLVDAETNTVYSGKNQCHCHI